MNTAVKKIGFAITITILLTSCSTYFGYDGRRGVSSSLVDYLYPNGEVPPKHEEIKSHLQLPLNVGLAFVPSDITSSLSLPESKKSELLEEVKSKFVELEYVKDITVIPETYLRSSKGFKGVEQIARLYGLDIIALVSYDQVAITAETKSSVMYWTIVGAYFIKGNQNQVTTFVDTAIFDVHSKKMLFRAPGVSDTQKASTLVEVRQASRSARTEGFELAMANMSDNLAIELDKFKEKIKNDNSVQLSHREGYGGGGAIQWPFLLVLSGLLAIRLFRK
ncbi:MAG: rhombotarget lipoprotein [Porticoccaceae bacterium]